MCQACNKNQNETQAPASPARRRMMAGLGMAAALALAGKAPVAYAKQPPKPGNLLTPDAALERLMRGNARYVSGQTQPRDFAATRKALAAGQNPYACILSCADSRVSPELCFDEGRGDLFVARVAGNYVTNDMLASLEYGVAVLKAPLIMVLGHSQCGAVSAAVNALEKHAEFPGHIQTLVTALLPSVRLAAKGKPAHGLLEAATLENIRQNVAALRLATPILSQAVRAGTLRIEGGYYRLETGKVERVA